MKVNYTKENGIARIQVERPEALNALNIKIIQRVGEILDELQEDKNVRVLIIGGEGNFAAGADIKGMMECTPDEARAISFNPVFSKLEKLSIPTIAAIDGYALGGGLEFALACDIRIASERAKLGFPEINLGIMPGAGGTIRAPRLLGEAMAKELIFTGKQIDAKEAERIGLINHACAAEEFMDYVNKLAQTIAKKAPIAMKIAKETIHQGLTFNSVEDGIALEADVWGNLFETEDQKEGMRAFAEKRKPVYQGK